MGKGSVKRFLSKHGARTFRLIPRSQGSDSQNDRVFVETTPGADCLEIDHLEEAFIDVVGESDVDSEEVCDDRMEIIGEAAKYGVLFDDRSYDYTQHLRKVGEVPGSVLVEAPVSSKLGELEYLEELRQLDEAIYKDIKSVITDPAVLEVLLALEDDAYVEPNELEDDFFTALNAGIDEFGDMEIEVDDKPISVKSFISCSDSDGKLNEVLDEFEEEEFIEENLGFDAEDVAAIKNIMDVSDANDSQPMTKEQRRKVGFSQFDELRKALAAEMPIRIPSSDSDFNSDELFESTESEADTEIAFHPTTENHPQLLSEIRLSRKTGMPILKTPVAEMEDDIIDGANKGEKRDKNESSEAKKLRKAAIKEERRNRRSSKKESRILFAIKSS